MRRALIVAAAGALLLLMLPVAPVGATPPSGVHIEVPTTLPPSGPPSFGPFAASGPAVDAGIMCPSGDTIDVFGKISGSEMGTGFNIQLIKQFTCDSEPFGEFLVKLQVRIDQKGDNFNWTVVGGSGAYEDLHGSGRGVGLPTCGLDCVFDVYDGKVHID